MAIERYAIRQKPVAPPPTMRIVFEGEDAEVIHHLILTNVTVPEALRRAGLMKLADQLYDLSLQYSRHTDVQTVDG